MNAPIIWTSFLFQKIENGDQQAVLLFVQSLSIHKLNSSSTTITRLGSEDIGTSVAIMFSFSTCFLEDSD